ncbi:MAG: DUF2182 domain-containing protein [Acidobacteria bacterium]|nr:DUF2182 domain-containing protein [Acidobacteriota bacterium]
MSGGMPMPGDWMMSMMWMPMGGRLSSAAIFTGMWLAMMIAMMLPSTMPMLLLYRRVVAFRANRAKTAESTPRGSRVRTATFLLASGYFFVWTLFGVVAYTLGALLANAAMRSETFSRALPRAGGLALCLAGVYQLTPWKLACLRHCRDPLTLIAHHVDGGQFAALRLGIHHGAFCAACCWALMLIQLVLGVMNLAAMISIAVIIALEKMLPWGEWVARFAGTAAIVGGAAMALRAF